MKEIEYNRTKAIEYAKKWAFSRNPNYYNFDAVGGDCTNFISQCLYAGCKVMNYKKDVGWYYINGNNKSPSWSGVEFLYRFLVNNKGVGPYGEQVEREKIQIGDIAQLSFDSQKFAHTLMIVNMDHQLGLSGIKIASHTFDIFNKPVSEYSFQKIRFIHIKGVRAF